MYAGFCPIFQPYFDSPRYRTTLNLQRFEILRYPQCFSQNLLEVRLKNEQYHIGSRSVHPKGCSSLSEAGTHHITKRSFFVELVTPFIPCSYYFGGVGFLSAVGGQVSSLFTFTIPLIPSQSLPSQTLYPIPPSLYYPS